MPFTSLNLITITGKFLLLNGSPAAGTVTFAADQTLIDSVANEIVVPVAITATLDVQGRISIALPATNDPDLAPVGWTYSVTENILGARSPRSYLIQVPYDAAGATLDLADIVPAAAVTAVSSYILASQRGAANGVASLDAASKVPIAQLPDLSNTYVRRLQTAVTGLELPVFKIQPDVPDRGPFAFTVGTSLFQTTQDFVGYFGYNASNGGQRFNDNEHSFAWVHESDYEVESGTHWTESYTEYRSKTGGGAFRPWFLAIDKATDAIQEHSFSGAPFTFKTAAGLGLMIVGSSGDLTTYGVAGYDPAWQIVAAAGRTPQLIAKSGDTIRFTLHAPANYQAALDVGGVNVAKFQYGSAQGSNLSVGSDGHGAAAAVFKLTGTAMASFELRTLWLQKATGQIGPLLEWTDVDDTTIWGRISKNGYYETRRNSAPADAELVASAMTLWWDNTSGKGAVRFKGKDSAGVVSDGIATDEGLILRAPDNTKYRVTVANDGALVTTVA